MLPPSIRADSFASGGFNPDSEVETRNLVFFLAPIGGEDQGEGEQKYTL